MRLRNFARQSVRKFGLDVRRWPDPNSAESRLVQLICHFDVSDVLDVGANIGQYGANLRLFGYRGPIYSFEPIVAQWECLREAAAADPLWFPVKCALGAERKTVTINVAANRGASSSVLPMLARHSQAAPAADFFAQEDAEQHRLDDLVGQMEPPPADRLFLKLDVQGYEGAVLDGASGLTDRIAGVQIELSFAPLYEGGLSYRDALLWMEKQGFDLKLLIPGFSDPNTGEMLQADAIFFRGA